MHKPSLTDPPPAADPPEAHAIYQRLTENLPGIVYRIHLRENRTQYLNGQQLLEITGYRPAEICDGDLCGLDHLIVAEDRDQVTREVRRAMASCSPFAVGYRLRHKDGGIRHLLERGIPVNGPDGDPQFIDGVILDITSQKLTEQRIRGELSERVRELNNVQRVARLGSYVLDIRSGIFSTSPMTDEIFGVGPDYAHTVEGWSRLVAADQRQEMLAYLEQVIHEGKRFEREYRIVRLHDQAERWLSGTGEVESDADGPLRVVGTIQDITERKRAEEQLSEISVLHEQIISSAEEGIVVYGPDLRYRLWNPFMEKVTGKKAAEVLDRHPLEVFPFLKEVGVIDRLERTLLGEILPTIEFPNFSGANPGGWTSDSSAPLRNAEGKIIGVIATVRDITERRQAEIALRRSENMLQAIIDTEPECVKLLDAEARLIMMNRAGLAMLEVDNLEQVKDRCVCPMIVSEHWQDFTDLTRRVFQGESGTLVFEMVGAKGRHLWLETHAVPFRNEKEEIVALLGVTRDITAQRQAEEALIRSMERYRTLYDETPILMQSIDRNGVLVDVNNHWLRTMGYERDEVLGRKATDFYTEASRLYALHVVQPAFFRDGSCTDIPLEFVKKNGEVIDTLLSASGERDADGTVIRSRAVIQDVTRQKRTEEAIRQSEQLVRSIIDSVDEGFILLDREFHIQLANSSFCRMFGVLESEVIGRHCYKLAHRNSTPCQEVGVECAIKRVFQTGQPCTAMHTCQDENGTTRYIESRGFPLVNADGVVASAIEVIHDVTDRYRLEAEQLKAQKMEAIGTLAGGIAHDFNNLLQGVFGYLSLAKMGIDNKEDALQAMEQAEKALSLSKQLAMQLLTFAKGGKPIKQPLMLQGVIADSAKFALSGSRCEAHIHLDDGLWLVEADEGQIGQVIQNIVLNADQAMPSGGRIEIAAHNLVLPDPGLPLDLPAGHYVTMVIKDNGPGISAQHLAQIFDPYFTTKEVGSGLGLATSYSIVKNHEGLLTVTSELGKGSCFSIYLPALQPASELRRPEPLAVKGESARGRILVMDDDQGVRDVAGQMLRAFGHEVAFAEHGEEAIAKYREAKGRGLPFDVVILDLTIRGGMGGYDTLRQLLTIDPEVKAVVSSGYSNDTVLANFRMHGFRACLNKPYALRDLQETLLELLAERPGLAP